MINKEEILKNILRSSEFKESKRIQELLEYLVKASENEENVKETTIAADLFGKDYKFDPHEDPTIRVYISNLRKKLSYYYLTEGKDDPVRIEIPKGKYDVRFVPWDNKSRRISINYKRLTYFLLLPSLLVLSILLLIQYKSKQNKNNIDMMANHPIWTELLKESKDPTLIVLGDYFFLFEHKPGVEEGYFVRDPEINSAEEFKQAVKDNPQLIERFTICNFTYLGPTAAESLMLLYPVLSQSPNKIFLKLASELKWDEMNRNNIIFIGPLKTLYELNKLFTRLPIRYQIVPPQLMLVDEHADTIKTFQAMRKERTTYKKDFGVILKQEGPKNNVILLLTGFDELGIKEAIKYSIDPNFKEKLEKNISQAQNQVLDFFCLFIEVEGVDRTSFKSEIKHFQHLSLGDWDN